MVAFGSKSDPPDASFVMVIVVTETHQMDSTGEQLGKSRQAGDDQNPARDLGSAADLTWFSSGFTMDLSRFDHILGSFSQESRS